jgi:hypothetical protein
MNDRYLENAKAVYARAERRANDTGSVFHAPCSSCRYFERNWMGFGHVCHNPVVILVAEEAQQGYDRERVRECDTQRSVKSPFGTVVCGPHGSLHEPKSNWIERVLS